MTALRSVLSRRGLLAGTAGLGAVLGLPSLARGQSFPTRNATVRAIVPFATGGTVTVWGRAYAQAMSELLGANVVLDNRPGGQGVIGMLAMKGAPRDGSTILFTSLSTQVINPHLMREPPYDPQRELVALAGTLKAPFAMFVGPSFPFRTAREFFAAATANPEKYTFGSISASTRCSFEMLAKRAGIKLTNVPYRNIADLISDLLSGRIDLYMTDPPAMIPLLSQGVRLLGAASLSRLAIAPNVPTFDEQGLTGFEVLSWQAAYAPAGTPEPVVATLRDAMRRAASTRVVVETISAAASEPFNLYGSELAAFERAEYERWGQAIREAGLAGSL